MSNKIILLFVFLFISISLIFGQSPSSSSSNPPTTSTQQPQPQTSTSSTSSNTNLAASVVQQGSAQVNTVTLDPAFSGFFGNNINNLNIQPFQNQAVLFNGFVGSRGDTIGVGTQQVQNQAAGTNGVLNFNSQINTFAGLGISQAVSGQVTQTPTFASVGGGALVALSGYSGPNGVIIANNPGALGATTTQYTNINTNIFNPVDTQYGLTSAPLTFSQATSTANTQQTGPNYHYVNIFNNSSYFAIIVVLGSLCGITLGITSYIVYSSLISTPTLSISQQVLNKNLTKPLNIHANSTYSANPNNKHVPALATGV